MKFERTLITRFWFTIFQGTTIGLVGGCEERVWLLGAGWGCGSRLCVRMKIVGVICKFKLYSTPESSKLAKEQHEYITYYVKNILTFNRARKSDFIPWPMRIRINQTDLTVTTCRKLASENATGWITNKLIGKKNGGWFVSQSQVRNYFKNSKVQFEISLYIA